MAVTNFLVSSLPAYVQENRDLLIKNFALVGTATRRRIGLQTGIKKSAYINYLDLEPTLQDGNGCGHNPLDEITLSQRTIEVALIKDDGQICPETLIGKYAEYLVRVAATENELPFERYILDTLVAQINKKIEFLIWQGDKSQSSNPDKKWIDGILVQVAADGDAVQAVIASGASAYNGVLAVYNAMPEEVLERGGVVFVGPAIYRAFLQDMVACNFYHYSGPQSAAPEEFILPGTDVRVVKTPGLINSLTIVGTFADNLVYGTDGENDNEVVDVWYSNDDRVFKYQVKWASGIAYRFPNLMVYGTFAASPTPTPLGGHDYSAALAGISTSVGTIATKSAGLDNLAGIKSDADTIATKVAGLDNLATISTNAAALADADHIFKTKEQA